MNTKKNARQDMYECLKFKLLDTELLNISISHVIYHNYRPMTNSDYFKYGYYELKDKVIHHYNHLYKRKY